jgi:phosphohistidine swiveling domain-containing protein
MNKIFDVNKTICLDRYERFFEVSNAGYMLADIYSQVYENLGLLALNKNHRLGIYLNRQGTTKSRKFGLKLYSTKKYIYLLRKFERFINKSDDNFAKLDYSRKSDVNQFFKLVKKFFAYYRYTEFFYTDIIYNQKYGKKYKHQHNAISSIKSKGRLLLNKIFLEKKGYLNQLFDYLQNKYSLSRDALFNYSSKELSLLLIGQFVDKRIIDTRKRNYCLIVEKKWRKFINEDNGACNLFTNSFIKSQLNIIKGTTACLGRYIGKARVIEPDYSNFTMIEAMLTFMQPGEVLITESSSPEIVRVCKLAGAIVANQGGMGSHAAIISREMGIPCIVGTQNATRWIKTGDTVLVDGDRGVVEVLNKG